MKKAVPMASLHTAVSEGCLGQFSEIILVLFGPGTLISERTQVSKKWATSFCKEVVRVLKVMRTLRFRAMCWLCQLSVPDIHHLGWHWCNPVTVWGASLPKAARECVICWDLIAETSWLPHTDLYYSNSNYMANEDFRICCGHNCIQDDTRWGGFIYHWQKVYWQFILHQVYSADTSGLCVKRGLQEKMFWRSEKYKL